MQYRFGLPADLERLDAWRALTGLGPLSPARGTKRTVALAAPAAHLAHRRAEFRAMVLRHAYGLNEWLPPEVVMNVRRVDVDGPTGRVLITLWSGTQLLDTGDRITVRGEADEIAISELVGCVMRRGWKVVEVTGDDEFRKAASRELLRRGIDVMDCPLALGEQERLRQEFHAGEVPASPGEDQDAWRDEGAVRPQRGMTP